MKKEIIHIEHTKMLQRVYTHTYYIGEARKAAGVPPHLAAELQTSDSNRDILTQHIHTSIAETARMLTRYLGICSTKHNDATFCSTLFIKIPPNYPIACMPQIARSVENYIVMRTLEQWLMQCKPDEAAPASQEAKIAAVDLRELLSIRQRPGSREHLNDNNIEI